MDQVKMFVGVFVAPNPRGYLRHDGYLLFASMGDAKPVFCSISDRVCQKNNLVQLQHQLIILLQSF